MDRKAIHEITPTLTHSKSNSVSQGNRYLYMVRGHQGGGEEFE